MAKFCRSCGAPLEEGAAQCGSCGADLTAPAVPAAQPKNNQQLNEVLDKVSDVLNTCFMVVEKVVRIVAKKAVEIVRNIKNSKGQTSAQPQKVEKLDVVRLGIAIVMIVLCLIAIIMNVTMKYDVTVSATAQYDGEATTQTATGPMEDLLMDTDEFIPVGIVCLVWAVFNLALIIMAIILIIKLVKLSNTDGSYKALTITGLIGDIIYMILYKLCGTGTMESWGITIKYSIGIYSFVWIHVVFVALAVGYAYIGKILAAAPAMAMTTESTESAE